MSNYSKIILAIVVCFYMVAFTTNAATTCQTVARGLAPCRTYLKKGGTVPTDCCNGISALNKSASTTALRRAYCECIKSQAKANGVNSQFASSLPDKCKVKIPYAISHKTNCNSIQ